jgi:hypothetical protein
MHRWNGGGVLVHIQGAGMIEAQRCKHCRSIRGCNRIGPRGGWGWVYSLNLRDWTPILPACQPR